MIEEKCLVCLGAVNQEGHVSGDTRVCYCMRCGEYAVSGSAEAVLKSFEPSQWKRSDASSSIGIWLQDQRRYQSQHRTRERPLLTSHTVNKLIETPFFPDITTQIENLITHVAQTAKEPGVHCGLHPDQLQFLVGCRTPSGVIGLLEHLVGAKYLDNRSGPGISPYTYTISVKGWLAFEDLNRGRTSGKKAFIAMPFNRPDLDRKWLPALRIAVKETGYDLARVDDNPEPGLIDTKMRNEIRAARFLLVELTHGNNGAYWEAGFAEGLNKPVIYLRNEKDHSKAHFDVEHSFRIEWKEDDIEAATRSLKATIREAMPDAIMEDL